MNVHNSAIRVQSSWQANAPLQCGKQGPGLAEQSFDRPSSRRVLVSTSSQFLRHSVVPIMLCTLLPQAAPSHDDDVRPTVLGHARPASSLDDNRYAAAVPARLALLVYYRQRCVVHAACSLKQRLLLFSSL